jgi:hypothetical protein
VQGREFATADWVRLQKLLWHL